MTNWKGYNIWGRTKKKLILVKPNEGTSCGSFLISANATRKVVHQHRKSHFPCQVGCFQFFSEHCFISFSRCQKCLMSCFEVAGVTIFQKMLRESIFSPHGFHQYWFLMFKTCLMKTFSCRSKYKKTCKCVHVKKVFCLQTMQWSRARVARANKKSNMPERAMCCARETHNLLYWHEDRMCARFLCVRSQENLARSSLCLEHFYSQRTTLTHLPLRVKNTVSYKKSTWGIAL